MPRSATPARPARRLGGGRRTRAGERGDAGVGGGRGDRGWEGLASFGWLTQERVRGGGFERIMRRRQARHATRESCIGPSPMRVRWKPHVVAGLFFLWGASWVGSPRVAAQVPGRVQNDFGDLLRYLSDLATQVGTKSRGQVLSFLNRVEILHVESEIDRLVGSPWDLSDSTSYKLSLAPMHMAYPVFDQLVQQMTRLDDIRSRRIQDLTVDSLGLITVNLDILNGQDSGSQLVNSMLRYFDAREFLDLGVFLLAQQPLFPQTQDEWDQRKHEIAMHQGVLAGAIAGLGALVEAGALRDSGTLKRCPADACVLGWYGGFSHLGYHLQPNLRAGLTTQLPWLEVSAGLMEQVRPAAGNAQRVFEMAMRESWLNRYTSVSGWDSFLEAAIRRVLSADSRYQGENFTSRGGLFLKREHPFRWRYITLRSSMEVESNLSHSMRYAFGFGVDYTKTGLSAVLQSSRNIQVRDNSPGIETRTGLFIAGTVESPAQYYVETMNIAARLVREQWDALAESESKRRQAQAQMSVLAGTGVPAYRLGHVYEAIRKTTADSEMYRARTATLLGDYLESRRTAYALKQWWRTWDDLYGPLDWEVLLVASAAVFARLSELALYLRDAEGRLRILGNRYVQASEEQDRAERVGAIGRNDLQEIDRLWRGESDAVGSALQLYRHYLAATRRIEGLSNRLIPVRQLDPVNPHLLRNLETLAAQPLQ